MVVEDLISVGYPKVLEVAREFADKLCPGVTLDDLASLGGEELLRAHTSYDPSTGRPWIGFLVAWLRFRYRDHLRAARKRAKRHEPLDIAGADGEYLPREDRRARNPARVAAERESKAIARKELTAAALKAAAPPPDAVARRAAEVRDALNQAVGPGDLARLMSAMLAHGVAGDVQAARLVADVFGLRTPAPAPVQAVQVNVLAGDADLA